jgi:hypothetical protein
MRALDDGDIWCRVRVSSSLAHFLQFAEVCKLPFLLRPSCIGSRRTSPTPSLHRRDSCLGARNSAAATAVLLNMYDLYWLGFGVFHSESKVLVAIYPLPLSFCIRSAVE